MSSIEIQQPLIDSGIRSVNFFNGRLLSGEDLNAEQEANREGHMRLGTAIGTGVVTGLEVTKPPPPPPGAESDSRPKVSVGKGMAINSLVQTLLLNDNIDVFLLSTSHGATPSTATTTQGAFRSSQPAPIGQYVLDEGVYLLTIAPDATNEGFSPVSGFSNAGGIGATAACNTRYLVDTIQFRLYQLTLSSGILSEPGHLRNKIAYACFGFTDAGPSQQTSSPYAFGPLMQSEKLLDTLKINLTNDVPLAILVWTSSGAPRFIDNWSVRRRLTGPAFTVPWNGAMGDRRLAEAEAMFLQFQGQIADIQLGAEVTRQTATASPAQNTQPAASTLSAIRADQLFSYLPAAGYLPIGKDSFDWKTFLGPLAPSAITCVDRRLLRLILHNSFFEDPIKVGPYADGTQPSEPPVDVYQDPSQTDFVLFSRSNNGRMVVTVNAKGYQPANVIVSLATGQQTQVDIPLNQDPSAVVQRPQFVDVDEITRPALHKIRFSIVQRPANFSASLLSKMIKVDPLPQNVVDWLSSWKTWFSDLYPGQGIDCSTLAIYINDYYSPPKIGRVPEDPSAYAVFGTFAVPLLINVSYYTTPLSVPLAKAGIHGLTDDIIHALAGIGILYVDQVAGAWSKLIASATGQPVEYGRYLISDALQAVENINSKLLYYEGIDDWVNGTRVEEILEQLAIRDDVALANADQDELGENLHSVGFANRLITQARKAVPAEHWSLESLGVPKEQIPSLRQIGITSKGEFAKMAETNEGHKQLESVLQLDPQAIDQLHAKAYQQMTASSLALAREKDLILLPNVNAEVVTQLAGSNITTLDQVTKADKAKLMEVTGLSEDAAEDLQEEAEHAKKEGLEVVKLASVTRDVANVLDKLGVKTISHLIEKGEEGIAEAVKEVHGDRAIRFVKALFDGIRGAGR